MRPTFLGFEAAKTGVFASQKALDIVGHNMSNLHTEGYTRQRVDQAAQYVNTNGARLKPDLVSLAGMGTDIKGVAQLRNERIDNAYRQESANAGYYNRQLDMMSDMESILNELEVGDETNDGNGYNLSYAIADMFSALEDFTYNASSEADANVFANSVLNVTQTLNRIYNDITDSAQRYKEEVQIDIDNVNSMLKDVAALNKSIRRAMNAGDYSEEFGPNELLDQRNLLLDKLSEYGVLRVEEQADSTITVEMNGHKCVWDDECDAITFQENKNGTVGLFWKTNGENAAKDTGSFKAAVELLNGRGISASSKTESTVNGYLYYQDKLDTFAVQLAEVLNNTIPDRTDEDGNVIYKKIVGEAVETKDGYEVFPDKVPTAAKINITHEMATNSSYLIDKNNSTDNTYLLELINKLTKDKQDFATVSDNFSGTFQEFVADYTGTLGSELSYAEGRYENSIAIVNEILDNRDQVSGVSEGEETTNMLTYNRAYQAAARMMTVMDSLLDVLINRTAV